MPVVPPEADTLPQRDPVDGGQFTPWQTAAEAAAYIKRGKRFVLREIAAGRLRGARIGGRGEILTRAEWLDAWVQDRSTPVVMPSRRRA
jgi:excisionase family DNA binding protein